MTVCCFYDVVFWWFLKRLSKSNNTIPMKFSVSQNSYDEVKIDIRAKNILRVDEYGHSSDTQVTFFSSETHLEKSKRTLHLLLTWQLKFARKSSPRSKPTLKQPLLSEGSPERGCWALWNIHFSVPAQGLNLFLVCDWYRRFYFNTYVKSWLSASRECVWKIQYF